MLDDIKIRTKEISLTSTPMAITQATLLVVALLIVESFSHDLLESLAGLFGASILIVIFTTAWSSRRFIDNNFFFIIGSGSLFVAIIDVLHVLIIDNRGVLIYGSNVQAMFWLSSSFLLGLTFCLALIFEKRKIRASFWFITYFIFTIGIIYLMVLKRVLPEVTDFVRNFTIFGYIGEGIVIALFIAALTLLWRKRAQFENRDFGLLSLTIAGSLLAELFFKTRLIEGSNFDLAFHILKALTAYSLYLSVVETSLMRPYRVLFKNLKDREVSLSESEKQYRSLIEQSPSAIFLHVDGQVVYANKTCLSLFHATEESQFVGENLFKFISEASLEMIKERLKTIYESKKPSKLAEFKIKTVDGLLLDVESTGSLTTFQGKNAIQSVMNDISKRKLYERQLVAYTDKIEQYAYDLRKFKIAVENVNEAIYITDEYCKIIYANKATEKISGYYLSEILNNSTTLWRDPSDESRLACQISLPGRPPINEATTEEVVNRRKNGQVYAAHLEISPIHDEENVAFYVFIERDVTRQKEIDQSKNEFVSLASHQLRTPLSSVVLSSELFLKGVYGEITERQHEAMTEIFNSCLRMRELISELLNISRIELGTQALRFEDLNIYDLLSDCLRNHELIMINKGLTLDKIFTEELPLIHLDKQIFATVVDNLMSNAIRYTAPGGKISVGVKRHNDDLIINFTDTGCGIPVEQQGRVFDKLFRADNAQAISAEGSGLGLYMAKMALRRMNSSIWVESVEGHGSTFYVRIPIRAEMLNS